MLTYSASFEFLTEDREVRSTTIMYMADTTAEAINGPVRFWNNRSAVMPDWYGTLLCLKVFPYTIGPIAENGSYQTYASFNLLEWKIDTAGMKLEEFAEYMVQKLAR